jgi:hypothetical protein
MTVFRSSDKGGCNFLKSYTPGVVFRTVLIFRVNSAFRQD